MARTHIRTLKQIFRHTYMRFCQVYGDGIVSTEDFTVPYMIEMREARRVATIINGTIKEFMMQGYETPYDINNGACEEFAQAIIGKLGGDTDVTFALTSDMFGDFGVLPAGFKSDFGCVPQKIKTYVNLPGHVWIYHKGRHYDAEKPDGVKNFLKLPIFQKAVERAMN